MGNARTTSMMFAAIALLIGGGAGLGAVVSSFTSASIKPLAQTRAPMTQTAMIGSIDQESAAKNWARTAFDGGLRQCPAMNPEFFAACEAEMKALAARPGFVPGSYGGPLLVTKIVEPKAETVSEEQEQVRPAYREASYNPPLEDEPAGPDEQDDPPDSQPY
jgi:hypothetical protein